MNKELSPLEALKNIKLKLMRSYDNSFGMNGNVMFSKKIPIIETALKENERLKICYLENLLNEESKEYIYKKIKALNVIKAKRVNVRCLMSGWNLWRYNSYKAHENLTQEEYTLLREVLNSD